MLRCNRCQQVMWVKISMIEFEQSFLKPGKINTATGSCRHSLHLSFSFWNPPPHLFLKHTHTHTHTHVWITSMLSNSCWPYFHMIKHDPLYQMQCYQRLKDWKTLMRDHQPTQRLQISPLYVPHRYHTTWVLWISPFLAALFALAC